MKYQIAALGREARFHVKGVHLITPEGRVEIENRTSVFVFVNMNNMKTEFVFKRRKITSPIPFD